MRNRIRAMLGGSVIAALLITTAAPAGAATVVLSTGHVDVVDVDYTGGRLAISLLDGTTNPAVERNPADVELRVLAAGKTSVPSNPAYSFLGPAGSTVWILPQAPNANLIWPGWNATEVPAGVFTGNLQFSLISVTGGAFSVYTTSLGNPTVLFRSNNGLPDTISLAPGAHAHANWAFNTATTYTVTFRVSGTLASTGTTISDQESYTFTVQN